MNIEELQKPLDPKHITKPNGSFGPKGDYIQGWHAINEANRIFGFDGWGYTIELTRDALEKADGKDQWQAAYTCICTLTVMAEQGPVIRQAVGFGSGFAKQVGDAIEGATKEAETDALKRALRTFGNPFGLALYDKERANVCAPPAETFSDEQRDQIKALSEAARVSLETIISKANENLGTSHKTLKALPASEFVGIKGMLERRIEKLKEQEKEKADA